MISEIKQLTGSVSEAFKKKYYGKTFRCPVCHLELAHSDLDAHGLVVCPLCGVVMDVQDVYGHTVPVVNDVELLRPQPKARTHPMAAHLPIGLFPLAAFGAGLLLLVSLLDVINSRLPACWQSVIERMPLIADMTLVLLAVSVVSSAMTSASGYWDWKNRYRGRPYRIIRLKLVFSWIFLATGLIAMTLHGAGVVFSAGTGLIDFASSQQLILGTVYFSMLAANMVVIATLGHVGGNLVFGK
ncbi:MAG: hypothetical protein GY906_15015 [bacterium]|nr:hypothetical protein [bacterium]